MQNKNEAIFLGSILLIFLRVLTAGNVYAGDITSKQAKIFYAGAATADISPPMSAEMYGNATIVNIHDELHARCLVLDDGEKKIAFVVVDILGLNQDLIDEAKSIIHEETGLPIENIMVSATHTHSMMRGTGSPPFTAYQELIIRRIADAVGKAMYNLEPARIGWGVGSVSEHVFIRRWFMQHGGAPSPYGGEDKVRMNPGYQHPDLIKPAGETDPDVSFISVQSLDGRPIALFANYSLHYVGGIPTGHISADYFAVFADRIQELLGADRQDPPFVGIMSNGTSGDVNNRNYAKPAEKHPPYAKMKIVAHDIAKEVMKVHEGIEYHDWVSLQSIQQNLTLKIRKPDNKMVKQAREVLAAPDKRVGPHGSVHHYNRILLNRSKMDDSVDILLQAFKIGDLAIATIPLEVFAETGLEIKDRSPFTPTFTIGLANGLYGYLPTPRQYEWGGYETWTSRFEHEASVKIVDTLMELFDKLE